MLLLILSLLIAFVAFIILMFGGPAALVLPVMIIMGVVAASTFWMMWKIYKTNRDRLTTPPQSDDFLLLNRAETLFYIGLGMIVMVVGVVIGVFLDNSFYYKAEDFLETMFPQMDSGLIDSFLISMPIPFVIAGCYLMFFSGLKLLKFRRP